MTSMHSPSTPQKPKLLDRVQEAIRSRHYSRNTEDAYVAWIKTPAKRPVRLPVVLSRDEVQAILAHLHGTSRLLEAVHVQHQRDVGGGAGWVELPGALGRKYPCAFVSAQEQGMLCRRTVRASVAPSSLPN